MSAACPHDVREGHGVIRRRALGAVLLRARHPARRPAGSLRVLFVAWLAAAPAAGQGLELLRALAGMARATDPANVDTPPTAAPAPPQPGQVAINELGLIDLHVRDLAIATVLEMISYEARANIVSTTSVTGTVSANLYGVTLEQALETVLTPNHYSFHKSGNTIYVGKDDELAALQPPPATRIFRLRYLKPAEAVAAVKAVLSKEATVVEGGAATGTTAGSGSGQGGGATGVSTAMGPATADYIVVTDRPDRLGAAERLLAGLDRKPDQVLVESTVLRATLNETNQLGIDFAALGGVDFRNVNSISNASADLTTGLLPAEKFERTTLNVNTQFANNVASGGFTFGIIDNSIAAFIRALEEVTDVVVVANPKIVALNKQEGEVIVGRRDGYLTTTVTETAAIQKVEFLETGTQIRFRPLINDDGTVRLVVHPKDSNGGLSPAGLPFEETTEAHADILVPDGGTVLIGGLFRERTIGTRSQVPVLGNIPLGGLLFGSRNDQTTREEVIILLTVHVLRDTPEELNEYRSLLADVERIRVGSRRGLMGTGRERLAQAFFHQALHELEEGHDGRALLNVRMTLNNQPKHLPALKLLEKLTEKRRWDDEGTRMRTFIWELIQSNDGAARRSVFGRPTADVPSSERRLAPELPPEPPATPPDAAAPGEKP